MKNKTKPKKQNIYADESDNKLEKGLKTEAVIAIQDNPSAEDVEEILDDLAATPKKKRVWEVDFLRGLMILFVVWDHFMYDVRYAAGGSYNTGLFNWLYNLSGDYYGGTLRSVTQPVFVTMFVFTSGVSCSFSNSNFKRAIKMIIFAIILTVATYVISVIIGSNLTIRFNVIHVIALSVLLWSCIEWCWKKCDKKWKKNIFGVTMAAVILTALIVGACANYSPWKGGSKIWFFLARHVNGSDGAYSYFQGGDYLPFLPDFGWFLVGAFLGKMLYREKKTLFPSVNPKYVSPITFCGRNSLWVYFISQIVMFAFIYLLHGMLKWL